VGRVQRLSLLESTCVFAPNILRGELDVPAAKEKVLDTVGEAASDAGLHALRHTFLTEAGEHTDPFTLQYVAGHDSIKTMMRYVHTREGAVEKLFVRLGNLSRPESHVECKRSVQNPVQPEAPSDTDLGKILSALGLQSAEVVELADTPS